MPSFTKVDERDEKSKGIFKISPLLIMNIITIHYQWKNLSFDSYSNQPLEKYKFFSFRSNHRRCSVRNGVLINFTKFTGKHLRLSLFFNKGLRPATLLTGVFLWIFEKFLRTPFLQNSSGRLLLSFWNHSDVFMNTFLLLCSGIYPTV